MDVGGDDGAEEEDAGEEGVGVGACEEEDREGGEDYVGEGYEEAG